MRLWNAIGADRGSVVSVIGAGGKTTAILALAEQASAVGLRTLVTTTTKMWLPNLPTVLSSQTETLEQELRSAFEVHGVVAAGRASSEGKLLGLEPSIVCSLGASDVVLCEADGAAGRSIKIHRPNEPVLPACTTHVVVVAGLDAIGFPFRDVAHPARLSADHFGERDAGVVQERHVAGALLEGAAFAPQGALVLFLLNKADEPELVGAGLRVARQVLESYPDARALLTARGEIVQGTGGSSDDRSYTHA